MRTAPNVQPRQFYGSRDRERKARKIEAILLNAFGLAELNGMSILDVGCGTGEIAAYFAQKNAVTGVNVENQLAPEFAKVIQFHLVENERLPFADGVFDVVISNHVVEHVLDQNVHVAEIGRVLRKGGLCYVATPNRWFPLEVHYRLPLLHFLPPALFHTILRWFGLFKEEVHLLSHPRLLRLLEKHAFAFREYTPELLRDPEKYFLGSLRGFQLLPAGVVRIIALLSPTYVVVAFHPVRNPGKASDGEVAGPQ